MENLVGLLQLDTNMNFCQAMKMAKVLNKVLIMDVHLLTTFAAQNDPSDDLHAVDGSSPMVATV